MDKKDKLLGQMYDAREQEREARRKKQLIQAKLRGVLHNELTGNLEYEPGRRLTEPCLGEVIARLPFGTLLTMSRIKEQMERDAESVEIE